jgi:hypothetical protein
MCSNKYGLHIPQGPSRRGQKSHHTVEENKLVRDLNPRRDHLIQNTHPDLVWRVDDENATYLGTEEIADHVRHASSVFQPDRLHLRTSRVSCNVPLHRQWETRAYVRCRRRRVYTGCMYMHVVMWQFPEKGAIKIRRALLESP